MEQGQICAEEMETRPMKKFNIQLQYGEHIFNKFIRADSMREALLIIMIDVKQELYMRDIGTINVSRPTKFLMKVES